METALKRQVRRITWFVVGLVLAVAIGAMLSSNGSSSTHAAPCTTFSKYAGTVPCGSGDDLVKPIVSVVIPCAFGFVGGPEAGAFACFGAVAGAALS